MQRGFTLVETVVVLTLISIVSTIIFTFYTTSINQYFALQQDGMVFSDLAQQSQRVAMVLRGATDISAASADEMTLYAYFAPTDAYVSLVRYYLADSNTKLLADVTPLTANPPNGTLLTAQKKTYTIIDSYYKATGVPLFTYLDSAGAAYTLPIADLHTIKGIKVILVSPVKSPTVTGTDTFEVQVSLRNRKTNL